MTVTEVPSGEGRRISRLLPSPILQAAHGVRRLIGHRHQLFFGFRISLRIGVFSDDGIDHEFESTAKMAGAWGLLGGGKIIN
jgi:hypothetical protein